MSWDSKLRLLIVDPSPFPSSVHPALLSNEEMQPRWTLQYAGPKSVRRTPPPQHEAVNTELTRDTRNGRKGSPSGARWARHSCSTSHTHRDTLLYETTAQERGQSSPFGIPAQRQYPDVCILDLVAALPTTTLRKRRVIRKQCPTDQTEVMFPKWPPKGETSLACCDSAWVQLLHTTPPFPLGP